MKPFSEWEAEVTQRVADSLDTSYGDAAAVVEGQSFALSQSWGMGHGPLQAAAKVVEASSPAAEVPKARRRMR